MHVYRSALVERPVRAHNCPTLEVRHSPMVPHPSRSPDQQTALGTQLRRPERYSPSPTMLVGLKGSRLAGVHVCANAPNACMNTSSPPVTLGSLVSSSPSPPDWLSRSDTLIHQHHHRTAVRHLCFRHLILRSGARALRKPGAARPAKCVYSSISAWTPCRSLIDMVARHRTTARRCRTKSNKRARLKMARAARTRTSVDLGVKAR